MASLTNEDYRQKEPFEPNYIVTINQEKGQLNVILPEIELKIESTHFQVLFKEIAELQFYIEKSGQVVYYTLEVALPLTIWMGGFATFDVYSVMTLSYDPLQKLRYFQIGRNTFDLTTVRVPDSVSGLRWKFESLSAVSSEDEPDSSNIIAGGMDNLHL